MDHSEYKEAKQRLKSFSESLKHETDDKPMIRMYINDYVDDLSKSMFKKFTFERVEMYRNWLSSYACKLHPKN